MSGAWMSGVSLEVRADAMDCLQVNLAALADGAHGPGTHLRLGAPLRLRWHQGAGGLPSVEASLDDHLDDAGQLLGLRVSRRWDGVPAAQAPAVVRPDGYTYVVADAFALPWTPYHAQRHMAHSFLVAPAGARRERERGGYQVIDAYHNDTQWGQARPGSHHLTVAELVAALHPAAQQILWIDPAPLPPPAPPAPARLDHAAIEAYLRPCREAADQLAVLDHLALQSWLLLRSRRLHSAYLVSAGGCAQEALAEHLAGWAGVAEQVYIALRRVQRGREAPAGVLGRLARQLHADLEVFAAPAAAIALAARQAAGAVGGEGAGGAGGAGGPSMADRRGADPHWRPLAELVGGVLGVPADSLRELASLEELPSCTSLRIVEIVELLERRLGAVLSGDDLLPEKLHDIDHLLTLVRRAGTAGAAPRERQELTR